MPTRTALIPADTPTDLEVAVSGLQAGEDYLMQNVSQGGQVLKYTELVGVPEATARTHLLGSYQIVGVSPGGTEKIWVWGDGRGVWIAVTERA